MLEGFDFPSITSMKKQKQTKNYEEKKEVTKSAWTCSDCKEQVEYIPGDALIFYGKQRHCIKCNGILKLGHIIAEESK